MGGKGYEGARLREEVAARRLVGRNPEFRREVEKLPKIARSEASVLVLGETGTGKEIVARTIHHLSPRSSRAFVPVNCGALPLELVESELFGAEKGAYTGAMEARSGLVEEAAGGTLFLDEVDCLPTAAQVKLLRFLQDGEFRHLGSTKTRRVDARVIAATNTDVGKSLAEGHLRSDLFYRLNVLQVRLPRLRDRAEDVLPLARHFLKKHAPRGEEPKRLSTEAESTFLRYSWPGNVRELEHLIQRALVLSDRATEIEPDHLDLTPVPGEVDRAVTMREAKEQVVKRFEKSYLERMLALHRGNISRAARGAQRSRRGFWGLLKKHGIDASRFR